MDQDIFTLFKKACAKINGNVSCAGREWLKCSKLVLGGFQRFSKTLQRSGMKFEEFNKFFYTCRCNGAVFILVNEILIPLKLLNPGS